MLLKLLQPGLMQPCVASDIDLDPQAFQTFLEHALELDFFRYYAFDYSPKVESRRLIKECCSEFETTVFLSKLVYAEQLSLGHPDAIRRRRDLSRMMTAAEQALECGADKLFLISGPTVCDAERLREQELFAESVISLAEAFPQAQFILEPLDIAAHKRNSLGTFPEALRMVKMLGEQGHRVKLCCDLSHMTLNGEPFVESVLQGGEWVEDLHFVNVCIDPTHELYGDYHIANGAPGCYETADMQKMIEDLDRRGFFAGRSSFPVFIESHVPNWEKLDAMASLDAYVQQVKEFLKW